MFIDKHTGNCFFVSDSLDDLIGPGVVGFGELTLDEPVCGSN